MRRKVGQIKETGKGDVVRVKEPQMKAEDCLISNQTITLSKLKNKQ